MGLTVGYAHEYRSLRALCAFVAMSLRYHLSMCTLSLDLCAQKAIFPKKGAEGIWCLLSLLSCAAISSQDHSALMH